MQESKEEQRLRDECRYLFSQSPPPLKMYILSSAIGGQTRREQSLKETFIKRYIVERTSEVEIRPGEQSEKAESCQENLWNEVQLKEP